MAYYRLRNTTNGLGKRDVHYNSVQSIEFKDIIGVKSIAINPGSEVIIEATYLPVTAQKLRADGLITVSEIDKGTYQKLLKAQDNRIVEQNAAALVNTPSEAEPNKVRESEHKSKRTVEKLK
jgi:hypothetical protein